MSFTQNRKIVLIKYRQTQVYLISLMNLDSSTIIIENTLKLKSKNKFQTSFWKISLLLEVGFAHSLQCSILKVIRSDFFQKSAFRSSSNLILMRIRLNKFYLFGFQVYLLCETSLETILKLKFFLLVTVAFMILIP